MNNNMMGANDKPYIWLRYTTQFTNGGRTHTIEMGIPVPLGATAETREQLIREAEVGMDQLSRHVEQRANQMLQRNIRPQSTISSSSSPTSQTSQPGNRPSPTTASPPPVSSTTQPTTQEQTRSQPPVPEKKESVPPVRTGIGASMLLSPGQGGDVTGNMKLSQFILFIRENWSLTPKQAMDLLNVKTLNGLNYREALKNLQPLVEKEANEEASSAKPENKPPEVGSSRKVEKLTPSPSSTGRAVPNSMTNAAQSPAASTPPRPTPDAAGTARSASASANSTPAQPRTNGNSSPPSVTSLGSSNVPIIPIHSDMVRDTQSSYRFDEEEDDFGMDGEGEDYDTEQLRIRAQEKLDSLREAGGTTTVNSARLTALQNVVGSQISEARLQRLIQEVWNAQTVKKLKVDQAEALISWAKEDDFESEVGAMLTLLEEGESYAGSDW